MSAKHTPGPWEQDRDGCVCMAGQRIIFDAAPDGASVEEARANRRLIAAAPELLHELRKAYCVMAELCGEEQMAPMRAAITKAAGAQA